MKDNNEKFVNSSVGKLMLIYVLPSVAGLLFYGIQNVIDGMLVGRFLGAQALASVNLITPLYSVIGVISIMTGVGCQALVGIALGKQEKGKAVNAITTGAVFVTIVSVILSISGFFGTSELLHILGADENLYGDAVNYLYGLLSLTPCIALMFYSDCMLKISGYPRYAFVVMLLTVVLNTLMNITFIKYSSLGVFGVGLATGIAFTFGLMVSSLITCNKKNYFRIQSGQFKWPLLKEILYNGSSEGMSELAMGLCILMFNHVLMKYAGADGVAAFSVIGYIFYLGTTAFLGISDGIVPVLSYNYGTGNYERVKKVFRIAATINLLFGICIFLFILLFSKSVIGLFLKDMNSPVAVIASSGAVIYSFAFLLNGFNILVSGFFTALANARYSLIVSSLRGLLFIASGLAVLPQLLGITGIWITVPLAEILTGVVGLYLMKYTKNIIFAEKAVVEIHGSI